MTTDPKALAERIAQAAELHLYDTDRGTYGSIGESEIGVILSALRARVPGEEEIKTAIRAALVEDWSCYETASKWCEDVLLTGCKKVGNGRGYEKPAEAADKLAADAARAVLSLLSQPQGKGQGETKPKSETCDLISADYAAGWVAGREEEARYHIEQIKKCDGEHCIEAHDHRSHAARIRSTHPPADAWRPIDENTPRDGTPVLLKLKDPIPANGSDHERWDGLQFVGQHRGITESGFDPGWQFAAPVGCGGFPDRWFAGWQPLPLPPHDRSGQ